MRRILYTLALLSAMAANASAQFPVRPGGGGIGGGNGFGQSGPTVSPYINLLRGTGGNASTLSNYYGIVRPEFQAARQIQGLTDTQNAIAGGLDNVPTTGSSIRFLNTQPYFQSFNRNGGGGGGTAQGVVTNPISRNGGAINNNSPFSTNGLNGGGGKGGGTRGQ